MNSPVSLPISYPPTRPTPRTGDEPFTTSGHALPVRLVDFWRWSVSDLLSNATRGRLAEFIVASALGTNSGVRKEWDAFDLVTTKGLRIEVKSSAYLQSWAHRNLSKIGFGIGETRKWDGEIGAFSTVAEHQADVYVFCVLGHLEKMTVDPLNLDQWEFYVLPTKVLNAKAPKQRQIGLTALLKLGTMPVKFNELKAAVEEVEAAQ